MKISLLLWVFCLMSCFAKAQDGITQNSVRVSLAVANIADDQQKQPTFSYSASYMRHLSNSRWALEGGLGYIDYYKRERFTPFDYYYNGDRSQRISADFILHLNVLKNSRHALRVGAGPSVWYQRNGLVTNLSGESTPDFSQVNKVSFSRSYSQEVNAGINVRGEYEFAVTPAILVGVRAGLVSNLFPVSTQTVLTGAFSTLGLSAGYRF